MLTAEALQGLDFLPRKHFLGAVIRKSTGADRARNKLTQEIEEADITLLPGDHYLNKGGKDQGSALSVQPDCLINTPSTYTVLEAKRIRSSSFQTEQLTREYVLALRDAGTKTPILWLLLGSEPPVKVSKHGKIAPREAIELYLQSVLERSQGHNITYQEAVEKIDDVVCWITWQQLASIVEQQMELFSASDMSVYASIKRLTTSVTKAVKWHS